MNQSAAVGLIVQAAPENGRQAVELLRRASMQRCSTSPAVMPRGANGTIP